MILWFCVLPGIRNISSVVTATTDSITVLFAPWTQKLCFGTRARSTVIIGGLNEKLINRDDFIQARLTRVASASGSYLWFGNAYIKAVAQHKIACCPRDEIRVPISETITNYTFGSLRSTWRNSNHHNDDTDDVHSYTHHARNTRTPEALINPSQFPWFLYTNFSIRINALYLSSSLCTSALMRFQVLQGEVDGRLPVMMRNHVVQRNSLSGQASWQKLYHVWYRISVIV